jgi:glycosyltransferase involved in cell wall biosynthesis
LTIPYELVALRNVDHFFVLTQAEFAYLRRILPSADIEVLRMGVDLDRFWSRDRTEARRQLGIPPEQDIVVYVGALSKEKGADHVLHAVKKLKSDLNIQLVCISSSWDPLLFSQARSLGAKVLSNLDDAAMATWMAAATMFVSYPSARAMEAGTAGFIAPLEAVSAGLPVVSPVLRLLFEESLVSEFGIAPGSPNDLSECMATALDMKIDTLRTRALVSERHSWEVVVNRVRSVYESLA